MVGTIRTHSFTVDRAAYLRTMYTYDLWRRVGIMVVFLATVVAAMAFFGGSAMALGGLIGIVPLLPFVFVVRYFAARRNVYAPASRRTYDDPRTMTFSEAGIHTRTEGGLESTVPWTHIVKTVARGGFTLLFMGKIVHLIVPDAAFASAADRDAFRAMLPERG